jgi:hypothetical protein
MTQTSIFSLVILLMSLACSAYAQPKEEVITGNSPRYRRAIKIGYSPAYSINGKLEGLFRPAIVFETKRINFHELEVNRLSRATREDSGLTVTTTRVDMRYQFTLHLTKNANFIPQAGLSFHFAGSSILTTNPVPIGFEKVRSYYWVVRTGLAFPCRLNLSSRFFIDTNVVFNVISIYGSWQKYHRVNRKDDLYIGYGSIYPFAHERLYVKLGVGYKF